jgi:hypothetical protein
VDFVFPCVSVWFGFVDFTCYKVFVNNSVVGATGCTNY